MEKQLSRTAGMPALHSNFAAWAPDKEAWSSHGLECKVLVSHDPAGIRSVPRTHSLPGVYLQWHTYPGRRVMFLPLFPSCSPSDCATSVVFTLRSVLFKMEMSECKQLVSGMLQVKHFIWVTGNLYMTGQCLDIGLCLFLCQVVVLCWLKPICKLRH